MAKRFNRSQGFSGSRSFTKLKNTRTISKKSRRTEPIDALKSKYPGSLDEKYKKHVKTTTFEDNVEEDVEEDNEYNEEEDEEDEDEDEIEPPIEPSVFDNLLKKLEKSSNSHAEGHQKRERQNIKGDDSEEESDKEYGEEEDIFNGSVDNIDKNSGKGDAITLSDDESTDVIVDDGFSDAENGLREDNTEGHSSSSQSLSKFGIHITQKLSVEDIEKLLKRKWKYRWNMPAALESSNCVWMGTGDCFQKDIIATAPYGVKLKLYKHWLEVYNNSGGKDFQSSKQRMFFSLCNSYRDILHHHKKPFYQKGSDEDTSTMDAYIMHSLNHVFKTKDIISKNDAKLSKNQETDREEVVNDASFLDQGFTRPKVLILLPLASIAHRFVRKLIQLTPSTHKVNVEYMDRFINDFRADEEDEDDSEAKNSKLKKPSKPSDYQALFGANNNDHFMVGIKFTRKSIRLYSDFYSSDMIVASPLGLITKIGETEANKDKDVDYLSSIEILVIDHADVISMQNWSHVNTVVEHLNHLPSKQHGGDIMRIRQWYLDAHAQFYRQTIILSSYLNPDINSLFNRHCLNFEGKLRLSCEYKGVLPKVILQVRQVYERFDSDSIVEADDARLDYFINKIFPKIKDSIQGGIMIFISSYFEFVRIRNFLKSQNASFCLLAEYTKQSDISRARNWFIKGQRKIMLYTERAHFYHRYKIRGIQNLIIYSLPERKEFYPEVLNMLEEGSLNMTCTVLFSRFDQLRLERIVGSTAAKKMTSSEKGLFIFK